MKSEILTKARALGFALVGITTAEPMNRLEQLDDAVSSGRIGSMRWLARNPESRCDPQALLPGARSVICCAYPYGDEGVQISETRESGETCEKSVARFARGEDYHAVVRNKLEQLWEIIKRDAPDASAKICVDTSPIMEKALAARAGLGWIGRHTILINSDIGSWFVLGEIITDLQLPPDLPARDLCGDCRACMDACPTHALAAPHVFDARRCISYLTIQHKGAVPEDMRRFIPDGAYGCDICQEACPYNAGKGL